MADNDPTDVATLEAEVAAARARFARTLDKLTDPATHEAMKNEVMERVEGYKDELLGSVEASARAKGQGVVDDLKTRAMNNPAGAALIGAGIAYHLYRHPPVTTLLVGGGTALLMRARGKRLSDRPPIARPMTAKQPRGYVPGGVAGYGYPVEEDAPGSTTTERMMAEAAAAGGKARALRLRSAKGRARSAGGPARPPPRRAPASPRRRSARATRPRIRSIARAPPPRRSRRGRARRPTTPMAQCAALPRMRASGRATPTTGSARPVAARRARDRAGAALAVAMRRRRPATASSARRASGRPQRAGIGLRRAIRRAAHGRHRLRRPRPWRQPLPAPRRP